MKSIVAIFLTAILSMAGVQAATGHGGGLDWQGGHNCRVGSCAGTYHCHQARAGICAQVSGNSSTKPKVSNPKISKPLNPVCIDEWAEELSKANVAMIQSSLKKLGYEPGAVDGIFGSQTIKELNAFEKDYELSKSTKSNVHWDSIFTLGAGC